MPLCHLCSGLTFRNLYPPNIYRHANDPATLDASAAGCRLCKMLHGCIDDANEHERQPILHFEGATDHIAPSLKGRKVSSVKLQIIPGSLYSWQPEIKGTLYVGIWLKSRWMAACLILSVEEGDELGSEPILSGKEHSFIAGRAQMSDLPSQAYFDVIRRWLANCEASHTICGNDIPELPKRVIHVAEEGKNPYLVRGKGTYARYAALSHCWGRSREGMTTTKNLEVHMHTIDWATLPKTFKDAILTCRQLGIKYIFIDRLCIVQDSEVDWEEQSALMGSIYHDSTLTLAASVSNNSSTGIFVPFRPSEDFKNDVLALPPSFGDYKGQAFLSALTSFYGYYRGMRILYEKSISNVLDSRSWAMQERYLSRRSLFFFEREASWCCSERIQDQTGQVLSAKGNTLDLRTGLNLLARAFERSWLLEEEDDAYGRGEICSEGGFVCTAGQGDAMGESTRVVTTNSMPILVHDTEGGKVRHILDLRAPPYRTPTPPRLIRPSDDITIYKFLIHIIKHSIYRLWYSAVEEYSIRQLTFPSDKLPAMAGIASRVHAITHDDYLAGHWRREFEFSLFWVTHLPNPWDLPARAARYRAPSWSWASIDGHIHSASEDFASGRVIPPPIHIIDASTQIDGKNPFGSVSDAKLMIKAHCLKAFWDAERFEFQLAGSFTTSKLVLGAGRLELCSSSSLGGTSAGFWFYDDRKHGVLPGPPLGLFPSEEELNRRLTCRLPMDHSAYDGSYSGLTKFPLPERVTYIPEELTFVKGYTVKSGMGAHVGVLVLAAVETGTGEFRRIGTGRLYSWDEEMESVDVLTII